MCMEDIRIGRDSGVNVVQVPIATGAVRSLIPAEPYRTRMIVSTAGGAIVRIGPREAPPSATAGFTLSIANPQMVLKVEDWGRMLESEWFAVVDAGTEVVTVATSAVGAK